MKATITLSALIAAAEMAQATVYLAGDSTMAKSGANDGVTDGQQPSPSHSRDIH
jgi:rhamnogalacturonan acetylesterase